MEDHAQAMDQEPVAAPEPRPGLFVYVEEFGPGARRVNFDPVGGYDLLAAPSTLELAYKVARQRIGLDT